MFYIIKNLKYNENILDKIFKAEIFCYFIIYFIIVN